MGDQYFRTAVDAIFKNWAALQLAVGQGAAGPQSAAIASWMVDATTNWFAENKDLEPYEVTEFLEQIADQELNLVFDDGSSKDVGKLICEIYAVCSRGTESEILDRIRALPRCDLSQCRVQNEAGDEEEMMDDSDVVTDQIQNMATEDGTSSSSSSNRRPKPETDEDGWTTIPTRKGKK